MEVADELRTLLATHFEWLVIRDSGRMLPIRRDEIEVLDGGGRTRVGFVDSNGYTVRRVEAFESDGAEFTLTFKELRSGDLSVARFVPRTSAAELSANIEFARLERANEAGQILLKGFPSLKLERIQLNSFNGRLAQIFFRSGRDLIGVLYDVTGAVTHESILATALKWNDVVRQRKKDPVSHLWIAAEKRQAANLQKLLALLNAGARRDITIVELIRSGDEPTARPRRAITIGDLWREKARKLSIPSEIVMSRTAREIIDIEPGRIDVVFSKQGETLRYNGLAFARVRRVMGKERAWFGTNKMRRPLTLENREALNDLIRELRVHRNAESTATRHEHYRTASEAWLESILRRNIKQLDANLQLSPIYNQFRSSNDKIDLLAIRRDGRLVIIELKTSPDRDSVFQAADYWRKIELQRRRGIIREARLFGDTAIADKPTLVYAVAPALSFHHDWEYFARMLAPEIELWRWELHQDWRREINVIARKNLHDLEKFS